MNQAQLFQDFETLPPHAQQLIVDFIEFTKQRYGHSSTPQTSDAEILNQMSDTLNQEAMDVLDYQVKV